jgi:protein subunit release factor B
MISESKINQLKVLMQKLQIFDRDIEEKFVRSGGAGGQNVNKVSTCVYIKHLPSGIEVKCQKTRSQADNRYFARRILCEQLESRILGAQSAEQQRIEKIRRQKRKRSKRAKDKMLSDKKIHSQKKKGRGKPQDQ